jgi:uncharacterized SAM-binding protein YcdF (DUF218 family)
VARRLVAVLGYSTWRGGPLHPICADRLRTAELAAEGADAVLLTGWSRRRQQPSEAELMREAWSGPDVPLVVDGDARTTAGNLRAVSALARKLDAEEVVLVTSSWHARRARLLARAVLPSGVRLSVVTPSPSRPPRLIARELVWLLPSRLALRRRRG